MNINGFDLNLLRVLDALLREGSTVKAGARIGLSQPAVSAALGRLREALDDPLFVRRGQGLEPTDFARSIEVPLHDILLSIESTLSGPGTFDPARHVQDFRISGTDFFAELLMPQLAQDVWKAAPGVRVQLVDLVPDNYVDTLERYLVDIALMPKMDFPKWVDRRHVFNSSFLMIARKGHPQLARAGIAPGDVVPLDLFCDLGHVLMSPEGKIRAMGDAALEKVGRQRRVVMTMPFFSGVCRSVAESDLVSLIPQQLAHFMAPRVGLDIYRVPIPVGAAKIYMIWHRRATHTPAHRWMRERIARVLLPLNEGEGPLDPVARPD